MKSFNIPKELCTKHGRFAHMQEQLNYTQSEYSAKHLRDYELANNLCEFLKGKQLDTKLPAIGYEYELYKFYTANSELIEELAFKYGFKAIVSYVALYSEDPTTKAKAKLMSK
jgi:hypothetical protein